jgi:hypothetical protein
MIVFAVVLVGCASEDDIEMAPGDSTAIKDTIEGFWSAYNAQDYDKCLSYVQDTYNVGAGGVKDLFKAKWEQIGEVTVVSIANPKISGSTVTVDVAVTYRGQSQPETWDFPVTKKDGSWIIIFD